MSEPHVSPSESPAPGNPIWILPILLAWAMFMLVGLYPEFFYIAVRHLGEVVTQRALVNSPHFVTIALAAYFGYFTYQRCREAAMPGLHAKARGLQFMVVSMLAFLNFNPTWVLFTDQLPNSTAKIALIGIVTAKLGAWFYIALMIFRYYVLNQTQVFSELPRDSRRAKRSESGDHEPAIAPAAWSGGTAQPDELNHHPATDYKDGERADKAASR